MAGNTVVKPPRPEDAIAANVAGATDGLVYRVDMCMGAGRPYTEVVMTVGFPGPFTLITHNPKARLPSAHGEACGLLLGNVPPSLLAERVLVMTIQFSAMALCCILSKDRGINSHGAAAGHGGQGGV